MNENVHGLCPLWCVLVCLVLPWQVREEFTARLRTDTALVLSYFPRYYKRPSHTAIPLGALLHLLSLQPIT